MTFKLYFLSVVTQNIKFGWLGSSHVCCLSDYNRIRARNYLVHKRAPELFSLTGCMVERLFMNFVVVDSNPVAVF